MAMGIPVVVSDLDALRELVGAEGTGQVFRPGDDRHLAEVLAALVVDPQRRRRLGTDGRLRVAAERDWRGLAARYLEIYAPLAAPVAEHGGRR